MRLIDADALKFKNVAEVNGILTHILTAEEIDNAPTVETYTEEDMAGAYNEGYACGNRESERPKGEYADISKLRLMTVEEGAGHTIEYAMGWKACVEWIKKGGAE